MDNSITRRSVLIGAVASASVSTLGFSALSAGSPTIHEVQIKRFKFDPKEIVVKVGDVIKWTNQDLATHTATADERGWDTGRIAKGDSRDVVVTADMEASYFCALHPRMKGTIAIV